LSAPSRHLRELDLSVEHDIRAREIRPVRPEPARRIVDNESDILGTVGLQGLALDLEVLPPEFVVGADHELDFRPALASYLLKLGLDRDAPQTIERQASRSVTRTMPGFRLLPLKHGTPVLSFDHYGTPARTATRTQSSI
jgi:hypothetical protein